MIGTIASIKSVPVIGEFKFKASNKWVDGGLNRTTIDNFYGAQKELSHKKPFELDADEPPLLLGEDQGPNPVEYALTALAACVTTSIVYHADVLSVVSHRSNRKDFFISTVFKFLIRYKFSCLGKIFKYFQSPP